MPIAMDVRFAVDRNHDGIIAVDEIAPLDGLRKLDLNLDGVLRDDELQGVYYEYSRDKWVPADREHREVSGEYQTTVRLDQIDLRSGAADVRVSISLLG